MGRQALVDWMIPHLFFFSTNSILNVHVWDLSCGRAFWRLCWGAFPLDGSEVVVRGRRIDTLFMILIHLKKSFKLSI